MASVIINNAYNELLVFYSILLLFAKCQFFVRFLEGGLYNEISFI